MGAMVVSRSPENLHQSAVNNVKIIEDKANWSCGTWFPLEKESIAVSHEGGSPIYPGFYDIGLSVPIRYLNGKGQVFYIGRGWAQTKDDKGTIANPLKH